MSTLPMIVTLADRPDLGATVARWIWEEWSGHSGYSFNQTFNYVMASTSNRSGPPQSFVLLSGGQPVGTSSFVVSDLKERPDLTPWLASVFVIPAARRRGHVIPLIKAVEAVSISASIPTLWLHTETAEHIYAKAGWRTVEVVQREGAKSATLMRGDFQFIRLHPLISRPLIFEPTKTDATDIFQLAFIPQKNTRHRLLPFTTEPRLLGNNLAIRPRCHGWLSTHNTQCEEWVLVARYTPSDSRIGRIK